MSKSRKRTTKKQAPRVKAKTKAAKPRERSLPGMEDHAIPSLERLAASYAQIRDERMELTQQEVSLKAEARKLMHQHGKTMYKHGGIEIRLVPGEEDVKVRIRQPKDDAEEVTMTITDASAPATPEPATSDAEMITEEVLI